MFPHRGPSPRMVGSCWRTSAAHRTLAARGSSPPTRRVERRSSEVDAERDRGGMPGESARGRRRIGRGAVRGQGQHRGRAASPSPAGRHCCAADDGRPIPPPPSPACSAAGARVVGKTNLDEFGMGSSSETLLLRGGAQPLEPGGGGRRLQRRFGRGGGGRLGTLCAGLGHRRLGAPAGLVLRRLRPQAHLRRRVALRPGGIRLVPGRDRHHRRRGRHRARGVRDHPWRGPARPVVGGLRRSRHRRRCATRDP